MKIICNGGPGPNDTISISLVNDPKDGFRRYSTRELGYIQQNITPSWKNVAQALLGDQQIRIEDVPGYIGADQYNLDGDLSYQVTLALGTGSRSVRLSSLRSYLFSKTTPTGWLETICQLATKRLREHLLGSGSDTIQSEVVLPSMPMPTAAEDVLFDVTSPEFKMGGLVEKDGSLYRLDFVGKGSLADVATAETNRYKKKLTDFLKAYRESVEARLEDFQQRAGIVMPNLTFDQAVNKKVWLYYSEGFLDVVMPFKYAPRFVGESPINILPEWEAAFNKDVEIHFRFGREGFYDAQLYKFHEPYTFEHYHQGCWGYYKWPPMTINIPHLLKVRDELEKVLVVINNESPANLRPRDMPHLDEVRKRLSGDVTVNENEVTASVWMTARKVRNG